MIDHVIGLLRVFSGGSGHLDEAAMHDLVGHDVDRTVNIASSQMFLLGHAFALEKEIPGAELLTLQRTGHELPRAVWDVVPAILRHTSGG